LLGESQNYPPKTKRVSAEIIFAGQEYPMKKIFIPAALVAVVMAVSLLFPSCKKKDSDPSRAQLIVGTWKNTEEGDDTNNNGTWDGSEHMAVPAADQATLTFQSNGTGTVTDPSLPVAIPLSWTLLNSDQDLRVVVSSILGQDTIQGNIVTLDASQCILKATDSTNVASFVKFQKQ
jgi:hypothetical protein